MTNNASPREGRHLDETLAIVEQQINERINVITGRRRKLTRGLITGLLLTTVSGGAATAAALTVVPRDAPVAVMAEYTTELRCIDGPSASAHAFFAARFTMSAPAGATINAADTCVAARSAASGDGGEQLQSATPDEVLEAASDIVTLTQSHMEDISVDVNEASFGAVRGSDAYPALIATCEQLSGGRIVVLIVPDDDQPEGNTSSEDICTGNSGYILHGDGR